MNANTQTVLQMNTRNTEVDFNGNDKIKRYNWKTSVTQVGEFQSIHKDMLCVNEEYQRDAINTKVLSIAKNWSWIACGAIVVTYRNGTIWVIDGQHRVLAAKSRSDITYLPCMVFQLDGLKEEAQGFLDLNTGRKPVSALDKQKALVAACDDVAIFVQREINRIGLKLAKTTRSVGQIQSIAWCTKRAREDREAFILVLSIAAEISRQDNVPVRERLLDGLWFLHKRMEGGLTNKRLLKKIKEKGGECLFNSANKAAAYYGAGGAKVWAEGMLAELNKGLVHKFELDQTT